MTRAEDAHNNESKAAKVEPNLAKPVDSLDYKPGDIILDRFKIIRLLGRGGMGSVYEIEHLNLHARYALKFLNKAQANDAAWKRFEIEARATGRLDHPNLVKVHDFGLLPDGQPFFIMDLVVGDTLAEILKQRGRLSVEQTIKMFIQVGFALSYAHSSGIVHRDIKPSNILIAAGTSGKTEDALVKLVDFGIAKLTGHDGFNQQTLTRTGEIFGSPLYMSPEQCMGTGVDHRSDLYSLGCVMFEALTGAPPIVGDSALATMMKHQTEAPLSLKEASMGIEFPKRIEQVVERLLQKNIDDRYQSAQLLTADLVGLDAAQVSTVTLSPLPPPAKQEGTSFSNTTLLFSAFCIFAVGLATGRLLPQYTPDQFHKVNFKQMDHLVVPEQQLYAESRRRLGLLSTSEKNLDRDFAAEIKKTGYFSQLGPGKKRTFNFPNFSIGDYSHSGSDSDRLPWVIPDFRGIRFKPSSGFKKHPILFKRFREDDILELNLNNNKTFASLVVGDLPEADQLLPYTIGLKSLISLTCADSRVTKKGFNCIDQLPNLKMLRLERSKMNIEDLAASPCLNRLQFLALQSVNDVRPVVDVISKGKTLVVLNLIDCNLDCDELSQISKIPTLERLDISHNKKIFDACIDKLPDRLVYLSLIGCNVTEKSAGELARLNQLRDLLLDNDKWTPAGKHRLKGLLPTTRIVWNEAL